MLREKCGDDASRADDNKRCSRGVLLIVGYAADVAHLCIAVAGTVLIAILTSSCIGSLLSSVPVHVLWKTV